MRFVVRSVALVPLLACGGDASSSPQPEPTGPIVTTILVTAPAGPLQVGATFALSAEVHDQTGATMTGKTLAWSSANTAVSQPVLRQSAGSTATMSFTTQRT